MTKTEAFPKTLEAARKFAKIARKEIADEALLSTVLNSYLELEGILKNGQ